LTINWLTGSFHGVKTVGLFEAKTKLSEICDQVAKTGEPVIVSRRGRPLVKVVAAEYPEKQKSVWRLREEYEREYGPITEDFKLPGRVGRPAGFDPLK
jgi:prevent-host-death family protein